jgi:hypothetical protein
MAAIGRRGILGPEGHHQTLVRVGGISPFRLPVAVTSRGVVCEDGTA